MFKEVVSLAIILGFIWNILYVEHPDTRSYTIAFVGSLLALSPFVLCWIYWMGVQEGAAPREIFSLRYWRDSRRRVRDGPGDSEVSPRPGLVDGSRREGTRDITDQHAFLRGPLEDEMVGCICFRVMAAGADTLARSESTPKAASLQVITLYIAAVSEDDSYKHGNGGSDHHGDEMKPYPILLSARSAWNWSAVSSLSGDFPR
ncbi:hypothetical protein MBM_01493 [Drepanopeziza brunnea f. sp. 'multigermtubi' MB_m1]|uniref:Uncharacterized protein n=1 Tax=Marssonina brunnea f. sp. multigermtubi (strain MB_m1) TaxID=1072389 RepID=K1X6V1_MARBU|nr:uncharacterized protein MBM_01493 [Drepanopeziza brunnea f. sp. 'multigermtubi' MB_m1]EKD20811.1 hypothetical protein MBM_01493 [Drepanopeziza brunnea f. sp. 'multigermtubi' MB_m1]